VAENTKKIHKSLENPKKVKSENPKKSEVRKSKKKYI
jgi:hypothetical protein